MTREERDPYENEVHVQDVRRLVGTLMLADITRGGDGERVCTASIDFVENSERYAGPRGELVVDQRGLAALRVTGEKLVDVERECKRQALRSIAKAWGLEDELRSKDDPVEALYAWGRRRRQNVKFEQTPKGNVGTFYEVCVTVPLARGSLRLRAWDSPEEPLDVRWEALAAKMIEMIKGEGCW